MEAKIDMVGIITNKFDDMLKFYKDILRFRVKMQMENYVEFEKVLPANFSPSSDTDRFDAVKHYFSRGGVISFSSNGSDWPVLLYPNKRQVEKKEKIIVGVNEFQTEEGEEAELLRIDEGIRAKQIERLKSVRQSRNSSDVSKALETLKRAASANDNVVPSILTAVERYATVGEISDTLRTVWGEFA